MAVLVEPLTIAEKALTQIFWVQERLPWDCPHPAEERPRCHGASSSAAGRWACWAPWPRRPGSRRSCTRASAASPRSRPRRGRSARRSSPPRPTHDRPAPGAGGQHRPRLRGDRELARDLRAADGPSGTNGIFVMTGVPGRRPRPDEPPTSCATWCSRTRSSWARSTPARTPSRPRSATSAGSPRWPAVVRALITGRHPLEQAHGPPARDPDGVKNVIAFGHVREPPGHLRAVQTHESVAPGHRGARPGAAGRAAHRSGLLTAEEARLRRGRGRASPWRRWGPYLSERQWGTVREDYSDNGDAWSYFTHDQARSPRLPLGRGRPRRHQRRQAAAVPGAGPVERARPDPEGAPVRPDQRRGQPRRGRQGVLLLRRQPADAQLHQRWLYKYPQTAFPYDDLVATNRARSRQEMEYELHRHRRLRRRPLLRRRGRVRQGRPGGHPLSDHRAQPVGPGRRAARAADAVVPQHVVLGGRRHRSRASPGSASRTSGRPGRPRTSWAHLPPRRADRPSCCSARTRPTRRASWGAEPADPLPKDGIDDHVLHGADTVNPAGEGTKAAAHVRLEVPAGGQACVPVRLTREGRDPRRALRRRRRLIAGGGPRPTSSTTPSHRPP